MEAVFESITTGGILHDRANFLVEIMLLNSNLLVTEYCWKRNPKDWGKKVACLKKIVKDFNISYEQLGCYIYRCSVIKLDADNFAKMVFFARQLIPPIDLNEIRNLYLEKRLALTSSIGVTVGYKQKKQKTLQEFLKELENEKEI